MLVLDYVSATLVASSRRIAVPDLPRPAAVRTPRAPFSPARWLSDLRNVMLGVLFVTALNSSGSLPQTATIDVRPFSVHATITVADSTLASGQQVLGQLRSAAPRMGTGTAARVFSRTYIPLVRTAPQSLAPASINLGKYPTEYPANNGYVYTGRRAQVLHHMREQFGARATTYASHSECATCSADLWTPDARGGVDNSALPNMNAMAEYVRANRSALGVKYIIWNQRILIGDAWQEMEDRGSITANHKDHVHITFADSFQ